MIDNNKLEKIQKLFTNEEFVAKFNSFESLEDIKELFSNNSLDLTDEELKEFITAIVENSENKAGEELSEEQMENVTGGSWTLALVIGGVCAVVTGTCTYKMRKILNNL